MTEPKRPMMTPEQIDQALQRMTSDALDLVSASLRQRVSPSRAILDTAWKVIERGLSAEPPSQTVAPDVAELANVLELVTGG